MSDYYNSSTNIPEDYLDNYRKNFKIILKDYNEISQKSITIQRDIYNNCNMYAYMYYKDSIGNIKKTLLSKEYFTII